MARTLKDVYIVATKSNVKELNLLLKKLVIEGDNLLFESESIESVYIDEPKNKQKVSLSELKRLIDTIPTREEITRLKRQISAYKTNYDKAVKHSLSKEEVIEELTADNKWLKYKLEESNNKYYNALKDLEQLKQRKWWKIWK